MLICWYCSMFFYILLAAIICICSIGVWSLGCNPLVWFVDWLTELDSICFVCLSLCVGCMAASHVFYVCVCLYLLCVCLCASVWRPLMFQCVYLSLYVLCSMLSPSSVALASLGFCKGGGDPRCRARSYWAGGRRCERPGTCDPRALGRVGGISGRFCLPDRAQDGGALGAQVPLVLFHVPWLAADADQIALVRWP